MPNLHRRVNHLRALVLAQVELLGTDGLGLGDQGGDGDEIEVAAEMPEEGAADADEGPVGELLFPALDDGAGLFVDDDLVVPGLDEAAGQVLDLLARLDEQVVALGDLDGDLLARVARPDVQARVPRPAVDGEEVEVRVEPGEDGVVLAVLDQV